MVLKIWAIVGNLILSPNDSIVKASGPFDTASASNAHDNSTRWYMRLYNREPEYLLRTCRGKRKRWYFIRVWPG